MHKWIWMTLALSTACWAQSASTPVGIVTFAQGDASVIDARAKGPVKLEIADLLHDGSRVITGANGKVNFVSCAQSLGAQAQPGSEIVFANNSYEVKRGKVEQVHKVPSCRIPQASVAGRDAHLGGTNMRGGDAVTMLLLSPVGTSVMPDRVAFSWKPVDGATVYRVAIRDDKGNDISEIESKTNSLSYADAKKMEPGKSYRWRVTALQGDDVLSSASAPMKVISSEDMARIEAVRKSSQSADEEHLMLGMLYEELDAPDLALSEYTRLPSTDPASWIAREMAALRARLSR